MAGRGDPADVEPIANERLYVLRNGRWQKLFTPVNFDRPFSGVSLAESFADACAGYYGEDVGLIPCADGGTKLSQWMPGEVLYDHAVFQAKLAMRSSTLAGVLWHQGESDSKDGRYKTYEDNCRAMFESLRQELGLDDTPFIVGGIGDFIADYKDGTYSEYERINEALEALTSDGRIGFASAKGLGCKPDHLHFNANACREFGLRYFEQFKRLYKKREESGGVYSDGLSEMERL